MRDVELAEAVCGAVLCGVIAYVAGGPVAGVVGAVVGGLSPTALRWRADRPTRGRP